jgi:hypothetical protein
MQQGEIVIQKFQPKSEASGNFHNFLLMQYTGVLTPGMYLLQLCS